MKTYPWIWFWGQLSFWTVVFKKWSLERKEKKRGKKRKGREGERREEEGRKEGRREGKGRRALRIHIFINYILKIAIEEKHTKQHLSVFC